MKCQYCEAALVPMSIDLGDGLVWYRCPVKPYAHGASAQLFNKLPPDEQAEIRLSCKTIEYQRGRAHVGDTYFT